MGYFQPTEQSSIHEPTNLKAAQTADRVAGLTALGRAQRGSERSAGKLDRVTVSPAADALMHGAQEPGTASPERLDALRLAIKTHTMAICPKAIAEAILGEESQLSDDADKSFRTAPAPSVK